VREDEDLDLIFSWREQGRLTENLTLRYERKLYSLHETKELRRYAGKYVDVYQFPDGRIEVRAGGVSIPYHTYDKLGEIDQGAIVENKRLGHALRVSSVIQADRDNRRADAPSTAHRSNGKLVQYKKLPGTKRSRDFSEKDLRRALENQQ
jgi:hypothetical protein